MKIHNVEQQSVEWFEIRKFKMTGSKANTIAVNWKWLETYITELVAEGFSKWERENFSNKHTDRGNELEEFAREMYELETWNKVEEVWFIEDSEYIGCSPDWLVWKDWWVEIKSLMDSKHFKHIIWTEKLDNTHIEQIQMCLMITKRKWWDYILFNPNYEKSLIIHRIYPDKEFQKKLKLWLKTGKEKIIELKKKYNASQ